jgi:chromosome segregation ATPase
MADSCLIETGVDKLVKLVRKRKKISIPDAARQLGVSNVVVEEWADFLEDEGIISIEYKFTTPYLIERLFTKEELAKKEKEFGGKKEAFVRKAEVALTMLDKEAGSFNKIKEQFDELKKDLGSEVKKVKGDLADIEKYEDLKNNIDKKIEKQQKDFKEHIGQIEAQIVKEEKRYADIIQEIDEEEKKLDNEKIEALSIHEKESELMQRLENIKKNIERFEDSIETEDKRVVDSEEHIARLRGLTSEIKKSVERKKEDLDELFDESKKQEIKILELQDSILKKVKKKKEEIESRISEGKGATKKFKEFFDKKGDVDKMIRQITEHKNELEKDLIHLIQKAKAFNLATRSKGADPHIPELRKKFTQIEKNKTNFEKEIKKLASLLKS